MNTPICVHLCASVVKIRIFIPIIFHLHVPILPNCGRKIEIYGRFDIIFLKTAHLKKTTLPTNVYRPFTKSPDFFTNHPSEK
ncbi:MAG: hypothetical protein JWR26_3230 [Pedosphaera sp.]|nr:hypothetical protein [Pedosphaera sp.]